MGGKGEMGQRAEERGDRKSARVVMGECAKDALGEIFGKSKLKMA